MGIIHRGIPQQKVLDRFGDYNILVETGTHIGRTAKWGSDWFRFVYTIESELYYHNIAKRNLRHRKNVYCKYGNSIDELPLIVATLDTPAIFWLDAHWSRDLEGVKPDVVCPVLEEIAIIRKSNIDHVILVDDARLFGVEKGWPSLDDVKSSLGRNSYVEDDVIWSK